MSVNETVDAIAYLIASLTLLGAWVAVAAYGLMPFEQWGGYHDRSRGVFQRTHA